MVFRALVFDFFDTLVDLSLQDLPQVEIDGRMLPSTSGKLHQVISARSDIRFESFVATLAEVDRELRQPREQAGLELPTLERMTALVNRFGIDEVELPQILTDTHMGMIKEQVRVPENHLQVLQSLGRRATLGLCSNFSHAAMLLNVLDESGLGAPLDALLISETFGMRKPRREIFDAVLEELGVEPDETLHVGDNLHTDVGGAAALGIHTAWITRRVADPKRALRDYDGPAPEFIIEELAELEALLDRA
jgi:HAD superfamily hydrolase (TIGR01509 family)